MMGASALLFIVSSDEEEKRENRFDSGSIIILFKRVLSKVFWYFVVFCLKVLDCEIGSNGNVLVPLVPLGSKVVQGRESASLPLPVCWRFLRVRWEPNSAGFTCVGKHGGD